MKKAFSSARIKSFKDAKPEKIYPAIASDCHVHTTPKESWLFYPPAKRDVEFPQAYEVMKIDHMDEEIIFSCDGRTPLSTILRVLRNIYRIPEKKVYQFLDSMLYEGVISYAFEPLYNSGFPTFGGSRDYFVPLHVFFELTDSCNQKCKHCYCNSGPEFSHFMRKEDFFNIVEALSLEGTLVAELTGGEPLLHPDFLEMLAFASEYFEVVSVITNGTLFNSEIISAIKELIRSNSKILISLTLNSFDEAYHDEFAALKGSHSLVLKNLGLLAAASIPVRATMNVTKHNLHAMVETAKLALESGASIFAAAPVNPEGRALENSICFTEESEWAEFDREFMKLKSLFKEKVFVLPEPSLKEIYRFACGAGTKTIAVAPNGDVRPCVLFEKNESFGNIFRESPEKVLSEGNLGYFVELEGPYSMGCEGCASFSYCNGCIRRMLKMSRQNPNCSLRKLAWVGE